DRSSERVHVAQARIRDTGRRVEREDRRGGAALEVSDEGRLRPGDRLLPGDVEHVAGERDVGPGRVVLRVRDRLAGVEELEVIAHQPRDEDGVVALAELLLPDHPRYGRAARPERAGGNARVLRVAADDRVERARVLGVLARGAAAEPVRARDVEDV